MTIQHGSLFYSKIAASDNELKVSLKEAFDNTPTDRKYSSKSDTPFELENLYTFGGGFRKCRSLRSLVNVYKYKDALSHRETTLTGLPSAQSFLYLGYALGGDSVSIAHILFVVRLGFSLMQTAGSSVQSIS